MFNTAFSLRSLLKLSILSVPLFLQQKSFQCSFWSKKKPNNIEERLYFQQINSNKPCEDRYDYRQLKNINAYAAAVYDGHGGWQVVNIIVYLSLNCVEKCYFSTLTNVFKKTNKNIQTMKNN